METQINNFNAAEIKYTDFICASYLAIFDFGSESRPSKARYFLEL